MYMAPPFLAYYGAASGNATLLEIAYNQAKQYRAILQGGKIKVWRHILDGTWKSRAQQTPASCFFLHFLFNSGREFSR